MRLSQGLISTRIDFCEPAWTRPPLPMRRACRAPSRCRGKAPSAVVVRQAPVARRTLEAGAPHGGVGPRIRLWRGALLQRRRGVDADRGTPSCRLPTLCDLFEQPIRPQRGAHRAGARGPVGPAVHQRLPRAVQFSPYLRQHLSSAAFLQASQGSPSPISTATSFHDLTGFLWRERLRYDFLKDCIADGVALVQRSGPCSAPTTPASAAMSNGCARSRGWTKCRSTCPAPSRHAGGTARRYHRGEPTWSRFAGAYHGWWDDVQPGPGTPAGRYTYTLKEMDRDTLRVLSTRRDIACVLVNPVQALYPNAARRPIRRWSPAGARCPSITRLFGLGSETCAGVQRTRHRPDLR